ncbi:hypothetical protein AXF42_Ash017574 [Apostasia shenzhenica]|uniref:Uncharacterized protein n=1 Tax=Apostasia shenzhenica TaxID=1088818 RepID=A0A2I0A3C2_9ASPA|nr:hypothetical protein AXF42_Ash017574 [Apostasia shenzhenica]
MAATTAVGGGAAGATARSSSGSSKGVLDRYSVCKSIESKGFSKDLFAPKYWNCCHSVLRKRCSLRHSMSEYEKCNYKNRWLEFKNCSQSSGKTRKVLSFKLLASTDDNVAVNGTPQSSSSREMEEFRFRSDQSLPGVSLSCALAQSIHDGARAIELAFVEHSSAFKAPWFSKSWLGVDKNAWIKTLSYQAAVHSLLQAAIEISSRGEGRDRDTNLFVQRSLSRLCAPLESVINEEISTKQPIVLEWYWSHQHPASVKNFVDIFEKDPCFDGATVPWTGSPSCSRTANDLSLLMLALRCLASVTKLGSAKVSCSQFFSMLPEATGRLMDVLLDFLPIKEAYESVKDIGLRREFLFHFGPRAASVKGKSDHKVEEVSFWIDLLQKQLQQAIDRERIWAKLTTCESIEVLVRDLAIFGLFIALGRSTQSFLSSNDYVMENPVEDIIRYLIGGSVLFYPQLSSISSYQLYVEVVCEELEWLPFYGSYLSDVKEMHENSLKLEKITQSEVIMLVLDVCSYWMTSFIKYSSWLENPSNIKAARFLSRGHTMLNKYAKEYKVPENTRKKGLLDQRGQQQTGSCSLEKELDTFDEALESVEEALVRLENLLREQHVSTSNVGKEHLQAACCDLEKIRKLKKEAEFLEASFRAKAASLEQGEADDSSHSSTNQKRFLDMTTKSSAGDEKAQKSGDRMANKPRGFWNFMTRSINRKTGSILTTPDQNVPASKLGSEESESNEIRRFEHLRNELIELEKRVQQSADDAQSMAVGFS